MGDITAIAAAAMEADLERLRFISQNLSNVSTIGYKAQVPAHASIDFDHILGSAGAVQPFLDQRTGAFVPSTRSLDLALSEGAYFQVLSPEGVRYTRRGDFRLDQQGRLVGINGYPVLGLSGAMTLPADTVKVDPQGVIRFQDRIIGQLALVQFEQPSMLRSAGEGLYWSTHAPDEATTATIRQGYLEASNVQPAEQMVRMMETVRHLGMSAQALRAYDQMLDAAINQLGE